MAQKTMDGVCYRCSGNPRNSVKCDVCHGAEKILYCYTCGRVLPCGGLPSGRVDSDCLRAGRSDNRTGDVIRDMALGDVAALIGRWFGTAPPKPGEVLDVLEKHFQVLAERQRKLMQSLPHLGE